VQRTEARQRLIEDKEVEMGRVMAGVLVAGVGMLVIGLITATSQWGVALVLVGFALLAGLAVVVSMRALRTHGATWDVNPGAAQREAAAEREASEREVTRTRDK
jgi:hypothetical protein